MVASPVLAMNTQRKDGKVVVPPDKGGKQIKCWHCSRTLFLSYGFVGRVEILCKRCRKPNVITEDLAGPDASISRQADLARHEAKRQLLGFQESVTPTIEEIVELMETRWREQMKQRARHSASIAVGLRFDVLHRDGFRCRYCGSGIEQGAMLHVDHVIPESKGGPTEIDNLVTACFDCNIGKSDKSL